MRNLSYEYAAEIIKKLNRAGFEAYFVGGCVRDMLLKRKCSDFDIATSAAPPDIIRAVMPEKAYLTGGKHGTVTVVRNAEHCEVTPYRIDGKYINHRSPENVTFTPLLTEDLKRRDFTINAMAMTPGGDITDPFGGISDIKNKLLRCVGNPKTRFCEDALRILRALRFSATLGFDIERKTCDAVFSEKELIKELSRERVFSELSRLICGDYCDGVIAKFKGILALALNTDENGFSPLPLSPLKKSVSLRLAALLYGNSDYKNILSTLRLSNKQKNDTLFLLDNADVKPETKAHLAHILCSAANENANELVLLKKAISPADGMYFEKMKNDFYKKGILTPSDLKINGAQLSAGLKIYGSDIKKTLCYLFDAAVDGIVLNEYGALLNCAEKFIQQ